MKKINTVESLQNTSVKVIPPALYYPFCQEDASKREEVIEKYEYDSECLEWKIYQYSEATRLFRTVEDTFGMTPGAKSFWQHVVIANEIYILDKFFDTKELKRLLHELSKYVNYHGYNKEIFIISEKHKNLRAYIEEEDINMKKTSINISYDNDGYIDLCHDRFAVLDNNVWHFGAKFAGMHATMNAYSGPWEDKNDRLKIYCKYFF